MSQPVVSESSNITTPLHVVQESSNNTTPLQVVPIAENISNGR